MKNNFSSFFARQKWQDWGPQSRPTFWILGVWFSLLKSEADCVETYLRNIRLLCKWGSWTHLNSFCILSLVGREALTLLAAGCCQWSWVSVWERQGLLVPNSHSWKQTSPKFCVQLREAQQERGSVSCCLRKAQILYLPLNISLTVSFSRSTRSWWALCCYKL